MGNGWDNKHEGRMKDLKEKKEDTLKYIFGKYGLMAGKL